MTDGNHLPGLFINSLVVVKNSNIANRDIIIATGNPGRDGEGVGIVGIHANGTYFSTSLTLDPIAPPKLFKKIIMNPVNNNIMYTVRTDGYVYVSNDGGYSWSISYDPGIHGNQVFTDIEFSPNNPDIIFAAGLQVWKYDANGIPPTWVQCGATQFVPDSKIQILPCSSATHPNAIYAIYNTDNPATPLVIEHDTKMDRSDDLGLNWVVYKDLTDNLNLDNEILGAVADIPEIKMNPKDENVFYAETSSGRVVNRNSGNSFVSVSGYTAGNGVNSQHGDIRAIEIFNGSSPGTNDTILVGTDGGILFSTLQTVSPPPMTVTWLNKNGEGLNITQFFGLTTTQDEHFILLAGAQDNQQWIYENRVWRKVGRNDGGDGVMEKNPNNNNYMFVEAGGATPSDLRRSNNQGQTWNTVSSNGLCCNTWAIQKDNDDYVYRTTGRTPNATIPEDQILHYSTDHGLNWTNIHNFTTVNHLPDCLTLTVFAIEKISMPRIMYAATAGQTWNNDFTNCQSCLPSCSCSVAICPFSNKLFQSIDYGLHWTDISSRFDKSSPPPVGNPSNTDAFRWAGISSIEINPDNNQEVWITFYNWWDDGTGAGVNRVNHTVDGGTTWVDCSAGLPPFPANRIVCQKGSNHLVYLATDVGVYYRDGSMGPNDPWLCFSDGLPIGKVLDLEINYCTQKLLAATFGRGLWEGNLIPNAVENITSSIVWSQPKNLYHNVIVKSGRTLTISASINFGSGIKITVEPNAVLQLSGATLTNACEEMWDGIYAQSGSFIYVTNSTIQNAYKAFNFENNTFYTFTNNTFDKNYISINIGNSTTRSYVTGDISGNIFKCTDNLPRYFGIPVPYTSPDRTSLTSIFVNNADFFALGVNGANQNTIKQMVAGVMSFGSNMTVTNTSFRDIPMSSQYNSYGSNLLSGNIINGSAIFSKGNGAYNLNVSGTNLDFTNCFTGVSVFDQNFTISNCHMDTTTCGILIAMCLNKIGYITNNYIESTERNINLYLNDNVGSINVIGNTLKAGFASNLQVTAHPGAFSIGVWEGHHSASNTRRINLTLNNIEVHYGLFGILLNSSDHVAANDNVISLLHDNNNPQYPGEIVRGFSINDCADASVYGNTVTGTNSSSSSSQYGFELNINSGAPNYLVCNNASNNKRNFYFGGGTSTTQLIGSTIGNGYEGLYIASSGFISQQFHTGNCFSGTYGNPLGAAINNNNLSTVVSASQFLVNPVGCYWPTNNWPGVWFIGDNSQAEFSCTGGGGGGGGGCGGIEPVDVAIVGENFGSSTFNEETQWEGKK